ncbi:MAG: molybdopterin-dependent oxidoreductase [Desulfobacter sp.]|nr:MAG: molybdopterin-dependent oxidoreductase [Desulfobacter sp.]
MSQRGDLVIVWGRNPKETNLHLYNLLTRAQKKGTPIFVVDPVETPTAQRFDTHVKIRPGTDGALALAMAHVLIDRNLTDPPFIRDHVKGFKRFEQKVTPFTPAFVQKITGVPQKTIQDLALAYGRAKAPCIYIGYGMQRYENGGNAVRCINTLAAVSGHMARPGAGVNYASKSLAPYLSCVEEKSESAVTTQRFFPAPQLGSFLAEAKTPPLQMVFFSWANPLVQTPDLNLAIQGFSKIPFKVVIDHFLTDTARAADLILPGATVFEQDDIFATSMYSHILNYSQKALDPPKTLMPEFEFYLALSKHMGMDLGVLSSRDFLEQCAAPLIDQLRTEREFSDMEFKDLPFAYTRIQSHDIAWKEKQFLTPSGRVEIYSERAEADGLSPLPEFISPLIPPQNFPLRLLTCHCKNAMHSQGFMENQKIPTVHIHSKTAARFKLNSGDKVAVKGENGQIEAVVECDDAVYENTAFIYQGFWHKSGAVNFLTRERLTDMGHQAAYYDNFCALTPV